MMLDETNAKKVVEEFGLYKYFDILLKLLLMLLIWLILLHQPYLIMIVP